jgi:hypothetical protein
LLLQRQDGIETSTNLTASHPDQLGIDHPTNATPIQNACIPPRRGDAIQIQWPFFRRRQFLLNGEGLFGLNQLLD